jgi:hypothetical protein
MMGMEHRRRFATACVVASSIALGSACGESDNMREDVILCEQAASHYLGCCGHALPGLSCKYELSCLISCAHEDATTPLFDANVSRCFMDLSCDSIRSRGMCQEGRSNLNLAGVCQ